MSVWNHANYSAIFAENSAVKENYSEQRTNYCVTDAENSTMNAENPAGRSTDPVMRTMKVTDGRAEVFPGRMNRVRMVTNSCNDEITSPPVREHASYRVSRFFVF
ncbi:hypothetical protein [Prolixibacter sp. SD074]|jgi:hypothetical protein|uniref:hypothetical protein n=1 Tax=Prolixibacter sp. SD074 TaxID=2652391 RepID=UPI00189075AA|nr:hypothetical protein [Prolixibacter sp. SD074]